MTRDRTPWLDRLLHLHDTPRRTAAAFALGVFFSFTPFIGLQILVSFGIAFLLGLNRLAVFIGLNANLPWLIVPWYAGTTVAAAHLMGFAVPADVSGQVSQLFGYGILTRDFWSHAAGIVRPFLVPLLIGPTVGAMFIAVAAYFVAYRILSRRVRV
jgi:uncharacterized protein (DUF2062 family)